MLICKDWVLILKLKQQKTKIMIRFAKHYFEGINGIEIYPIISLVLFFIIFITMVIIVFKIPKDSIEEISNLPFENDSQNNNYEQS